MTRWMVHARIPAPTFKLNQVNLIATVQRKNEQTDSDNDWALFSSPKKQKVFKILCYIEFCDTCMKH